MSLIQYCSIMDVIFCTISICCPQPLNCSSMHQFVTSQTACTCFPDLWTPLEDDFTPETLKVTFFCKAGFDVTNWRCQISHDFFSACNVCISICFSIVFQVVTTNKFNPSQNYTLIWFLFDEETDNWKHFRIPFFQCMYLMCHCRSFTVLLWPLNLLEAPLKSM